MIHLMGWRIEPRTNPFFMRSHALRSHGLNLLDNERVNIRPRTFFWISKFGPIRYDNKRKNKIKIRSNLIEKQHYLFLHYLFLYG